MSQSSERPRKPAPRLIDYPHQVGDIIRYADLDPQGHVNNAVFSTYLESGRVAMFRNRDLGIGIENATIVLVRQEIDFLRELRWPGEVTVGTGLIRLGRTSFTTAQVIFDGEHCAAIGRATLVMLDATTRQPRTLPPEAIARLEQWKYRGSDAESR
jgi:acyl-CoA thioester hydrolase